MGYTSTSQRFRDRIRKLHDDGKSVDDIYHKLLKNNKNAPTRSAIGKIVSQINAGAKK